jgi:hypothetical protein
MSRVTRHVTRIEPASFLAVVLILTGTASPGQIHDITQPPPIVHSAGQFRARPLSRPPVIDGQAWAAVEVHWTHSPGTVPLRTRMFSLTMRDCGDHGGDFTRCQLLFHRGGDAPARIDAGFTAWVFVTPDSRYIITEPLYALDVRNWKQYALFEALKIPNYNTIEAISGDGRRLLVKRRDCAMDCGDVRVEYYELLLPQ